ncbi:MAG: HEAT repeat domain-containing protein [Candidatus Eremiobacterota bacterium]
MYKNCDKCAQINNINELFCIRCGNIFATEDCFLKFYETRMLKTEKLTERYIFLKTIKSGGMGTIFMALDRNLGKVCAIKELHKHSLYDESSDMEMFETEAKLLSSLNHPGLPRVYDYFTVNGTYYLAMDYIVGDDLLTIMNENNYEKGFPEEQVIEWAIHLCNILSYLHNREPSIIYRDLKPDNIMIRRADKALLLIDFGIARISMGTSSSLQKYVTPGYSPPEQYAGKPGDIRSDIYSLGATLYHLITGIHPQGFLQDSPPKKINPAISLYMDYIIKKAKELKLQDRYQSVNDIKQSLLLWKDPFSVVQNEKGLSDTDLLILQLKSKDIKKKLHAIKTLSGVIQEKATVALIKMLSDPDIRVQKESAIALGLIGDNIAIDGLLNLIKSDNKCIRAAALESLKQIRFPDDENIISAWLKDLFFHEDSSVRYFAFNLLSNLKYESFYTELFNGLTDKDCHVRRLCATTLAEYGKADAIKPLKRAIEREGLFSIGTKRALQNALNQLIETIKKNAGEEEECDNTNIESNAKTYIIKLPGRIPHREQHSSQQEDMGNIYSTYEKNDFHKDIQITSEKSHKTGLLQKYRQKIKEGTIKISDHLLSGMPERKTHKIMAEEIFQEEKAGILKKPELKHTGKTMKTSIEPSLQDLSQRTTIPFIRMKQTKKDNNSIEVFTQPGKIEKERISKSPGIEEDLHYKCVLKPDEKDKFSEESVKVSITQPVIKESGADKNKLPIRKRDLDIKYCTGKLLCKKNK